MFSTANAWAIFFDKEITIDYQQMFMSWMVKYQKTYPNKDEYRHRLKQFHRNAVMIQKHQESGADVELSLNMYSDLTEQEWKDYFPVVHPYHPTVPAIPESKDIPALNATSDHFDWMKCVGPSVAITQSCNAMSYALTAQSAVEVLYCHCQNDQFYPFSYQ